MPLTYIDIEKQKTWRISILFLVLLLMYIVVTLSLVQGIMFFFPIFFITAHSFLIFTNPSYLLIITAFSFFLAAIHFGFSAFGAVGSVMKNLGAIPPDPEDGIHRRLLNVMDEIHVVTGDKRKIRCLVIPTLSMNAIAVADLKGDAAIAITEGLLSRLTRPQLEAVMAHEAYHILSGDCLEATVVTSLFGMHAAMLDKLQDFGDDERSGLHPAFLLFWILVKLSNLLSLFISREREYRADAASVRMTRNPLAMAEALHLIMRNWRGTGIIANGLEMLCIINPRKTEENESEGFRANLLSTHPPIRKRIKILLSMVRVSISELDKKVRVKAVPSDKVKEDKKQYYVLDPNQQWQGPLSFHALTLLPWFSPQTWLSKSPVEKVERASEEPLVNTIFTERLAHDVGRVSSFMCPLCKQALSDTSYEKTNVHQCHFCRGILVENTKIPRIIARREEECTERVASLAKAVMTDNQRKLSLKKLRGSMKETKPLVACPQCKNPMFRTFYSLAYLIEIDRCSFCKLTWFDRDELEMLQCVIENKMTTRLHELDEWIAS
jgi:heat shock protein HtpX